MKNKVQAGAETQGPGRRFWKPLSRVYADRKGQSRIHCNKRKAVRTDVPRLRFEAGSLDSH